MHRNNLNWKGPQTIKHVLQKHACAQKQHRGKAAWHVDQQQATTSTIRQQHRNIASRQTYMYTTLKMMKMTSVEPSWITRIKHVKVRWRRWMGRLVLFRSCIIDLRRLLTHSWSPQLPILFLTHRHLNLQKGTNIIADWLKNTLSGTRLENLRTFNRGESSMSKNPYNTIYNSIGEQYF
jgi:hypothetical protein